MKYFCRDGKFVQDVDMKDGGPEDSTILTLQKMTLIKL